MTRPHTADNRLGRIYHLLSVNRRLLKIARECEFIEEVAVIRAEIEKLKLLRRLASAAS